MKKTIAIAVLSAFLGGLATYAYAEKQPHMKQALNHLNQALDALKKGSADKGGHRVKAIGHVEEAIKEVNAGMAFDDKH